VTADMLADTDGKADDSAAGAACKNNMIVLLTDRVLHQDSAVPKMT